MARFHFTILAKHYQPLNRALVAIPLNIKFKFKFKFFESQYSLKITSHTESDSYPAVSPDGKSIAFYGKYDGNKTWSIHTINIDGTNMQRLTSAKNKWDSSPTWSPDAKTDTSEISIADSDGSNVIRLTQNNADDWYPEISPDGTQIVFMSDRDGNREIYTMDIDGSNQKRLTVNDVADWNPSWFADGSKLIFTSENKEDFFDIYMMNKDGSFQVISFCYFLELYLCFRLAKN